MEAWQVTLLKNIIFSFFITLCLSVPAQAKLFYNDKELVDFHISSIKGFLYDLVQTQEIAIKKQIIAKFARTIVWLEKKHRDEKKHELKKNKTKDKNVIEDIKLIKASIKYLALIQKGEDPDISPKVIEYWAKRGRRVVAEYEIQKDNKVHWVLKLKE